MSTIIHTGLIGWPVAHSKSPQLHAAWMQQCGIVGEYHAIEVMPEELENFLNDHRIIESSNHRLTGLNVTVPHKEAVFRWCVHVDDVAKKIGAVNTLYRNETGAWCGTNTDAFGFIENLHQRVSTLAPYLSHAVILGAGGAARAALVALRDAGIERITLLNRTPEKAEKLAHIMDQNITVAPWEDRANRLHNASMLINTTSLGMQDKEPLTIDLQALPTTALVHDIVYVPLETELLKNARARGNLVVDGLGMLIYQAQKAFQIWHGVTPKITPKIRAMLCA